MMEKLHWLGHASFRIDGSRTVYIDPWKLPRGAKQADVILVTHEHFDHFSKDDIASISGSETVIVTNAQVAAEVKKAKIPCSQVIALAPGGSCDARGVGIQAVPSYNINKEFHPKKAVNLGFIVTIDGTVIYHAGDTDHIPEMDSYRCDIALLPVSGTYVMTADEAARAAAAMHPKVAVPMHYGDIVGSDADAKAFADLLRGNVEVRILKKEK
jgi:L-ascorbate metabolism protein UlaG (beta-lactamase superfamily)